MWPRGGQAVPQPSQAFKHTLNFKHMITLNYFSGIIHTLELNGLLDLSPYVRCRAYLCRRSQNAEGMRAERERHHDEDLTKHPGKIKTISLLMSVENCGFPVRRWGSHRELWFSLQPGKRATIF